MRYFKSVQRVATLILVVTLNTSESRRSNKQSRDLESESENGTDPEEVSLLEKETTWITGNVTFPFELTDPTLSVKIGSFNLKQFGKKKANNGDVLKIISKIVMRYDLIALQEITDVKENAMKKLLGAINEASSYPYHGTISPRVGRTKQQEQYGLIYRPDIFQVKRAIVFNDSDGDPFSREPHISEVVLKPNGEKFVLINIHVAPRDAASEINHLTDVHSWVQKHWRLPNIIILGDLNADCAYIRKKDIPNIRLLHDSKKYNWLIPSGVDTTVGNTSCAYDRIIVSGPYLRKYLVSDSAKPFEFDKEFNLDQSVALSVSDHYPVEFSMLTRIPPSEISENVHGSSAPVKVAVIKLPFYGFFVALCQFMLFEL